MTSVERLEGGPFGVGSTARIEQPCQPPSRWTVTEFAPERRFVWETWRPGFRIRGAHQVEADGAGTRNVLRVELVGWVGALLWPLLRWMVRWALRQENRGLKARCEEPSD